MRSDILSNIRTRVSLQEGKKIGERLYGYQEKYNLNLMRKREVLQRQETQGVWKRPVISKGSRRIVEEK